MADKITTASAAWLTDPTVFAVNRTPAHSNHVTFSHIPAIGEPSDLKQSLDGEWRVEMVQASDIDLEEEPFAAEDFDDSAFGRIDVPSHLQNAGYMNHKYVNVQYPWDGHENPQEPNVPETNHVALYRRTFTVAERLDAARQNGGTVSITFHGMATAIYVWVNGVFVGYGEDGYTPNEFDITEALHDGENVVAVACYEYASASWLEDQDYWRLHGLFRSVELAAQPHVHIEDMKVEADWNPETATGSLDALLAVRNAKNAATVSATLKDLSGNVVWETALAASDETGIVSGSLDVKPWSAESPALYELQVVVIGHDSAIVETATQRVGFRRFRIEDGIMKLNGKRVVFKGADRHEFDAKRGRAITRQDMIDDITFCKRHNINAIRTSHYPNQEYWYDLCDEYGIYLIDETNLETHGSWCLPGDVVTEDSAVPGSKPEWEGACVDRVNSMMKRDYNHASVVIWSLGNESYTGDVFRAMSVHVHELDPNRPVHYEGVTHNRKYDDVTDIESRMYAHADEIEEYLKSNPKKPYISCEYMHAMGNSVGNMDEYTALERYPQYQGGFIWDFIDQAILVRLPDGDERLCYGGDFGDRPSDYEFAGDGIVFADRTPSPKAQDVKQLYANVRIVPGETGVEIANDNLFVSTADYVFVTRVLADGEPVWQAEQRFDVPAGETKHFDIEWPLEAYRGQANELTLEVSQRLAAAEEWAPKGYELSFGQTVVAGSKPVAASEAKPVDGIVTVGRWNAGVQGSGREILLSRTQGGIVSYTLDGREFVLRRPTLTTFRALTDNDRGAGHGYDRAQWVGAGRYAKCVNNTIEQVNDDTLKAVYEYELATPQRTHVTITYVADTTGKLHLSVDYPGETQEAPTIPAFGLEWTLPVEYSNLRFYGPGPDETYADRKHAKLGIWNTNAYDDHAPYLMPQETGNHEDVRWAEITDDAGHGMRVSRHGESAFALSLQPYSAFMLEEAQHQDELPAPKHMFLRVLAAQMGVGGDDSWMSPVHPQYHIPADKPLHLDVDIELI